MSGRIIDLTVTLTNNMPAQKFFPKPVIVPHFGHEEFRQWNLGIPGDQLGGATTFIGMVDHVGTHVDAFFHVREDGETIDEMPLDMFMGKAVCLDLTHIPDLGEIDVADFEAAERKAKVTIDGHIVLLNTGLHNRHFPTEKSVWSNPGITAAATHWLADRGSRLHGVEGPSTDRRPTTCFRTIEPAAIDASRTMSGCAILKTSSEGVSSIFKACRSRFVVAAARPFAR
jgi:kynurenine formamidase